MPVLIINSMLRRFSYIYCKQEQYITVVSLQQSKHAERQREVKERMGRKKGGGAEEEKR